MGEHITSSLQEFINLGHLLLLTSSNHHQVQVPLSAPSSASVDMGLPGPGLSGLPSTHLTATTLLGGGSEDRETLGQLYASQIASFLTLRNPDEKRTLLLGLGFEKVEVGRESFFDIIELVQQVL